MELHPQALTNGNFLVNFLMRHPNDSLYRAIQQRYWPHYHTKNIPMEAHSSNIWLICPAHEAAVFAELNNLIPVRFWVQLKDPSISFMDHLTSQL